MRNKKADLIFMKWKAELASMDRTWANVDGNFELLWSQFHAAKIKMDDALTYLDKACKAHHPNDSTIKNAYKRVKHYGYDSYKEYGDQWKEKIDNKCKEIFFAFYEIDGLAKATDGKIGGMSRVEYAKLQKYADSHELVDWESLVDDKAEITDEEDLNIDVDNIDLDVNLGDL